MKVNPVTRTSLSDAVFNALRDQILSGQLAPGASLPGERELCAAFEVNRGALREALKRLEQLRLVQVRQGGATRILDFRAEGGLELMPSLLLGPDAALRRASVRALFEMRSAIGPDVARLAARRRSDEDAEAIEALVSELRTLEVPTELQRKNMELWEHLSLASQNIAYRLTYNSMKRAWQPIQDAAAAALMDELGDRKRYAALAAAIRTQDEKKATRVARGLLDAGFRGVEQFLQLHR